MSALLCTALVSGCGILSEENGQEIPGSPVEVSDKFNVLAETILASQEDIPSKIAALQAINPDIYAWIEVPDTNLSFPLLQSAEDEFFYLNHNIGGEEDDDGCIYTEYYNNKNFSDPNTVIYGRNTDVRFGRLHQYQDRDFFDAHREIKIYLPDKTLTYQIFAAYTYDDRHLIATYDFSDATVFANYLEDVFTIRAMDAFIDEKMEVAPEDKIITLSTGVDGQDDKRYLVQAVLRND